MLARSGNAEQIGSSDKFRGGNTADSAPVHLHDAEADYQRHMQALKGEPSGIQSTRDLRIRCLADARPGRIGWLWRDYIPLRAVSILDGDPGVGKSTITLDLAARVSCGKSMPHVDDTTHLRKPADVVILNVQDPVEEIILPRLDAAGGDARRVHVVDAATNCGETRTPVLPYDLARIEGYVMETGAQLLVIDPFMDYLCAQSDAPSCVHELKLLANRTGAAVVLIRHLTRALRGPALYRGQGRIGVSGAARAVLIASCNPADPTQMVLAPVKPNFCAVGAASLSYRIVEANNGAATIAWGDTTELTADEILARPQRHGRDSQRRELVEWIQDHGGETRARDLRDSWRGRYPTADAANAALRELAEAGYGTFYHCPSGPTGGRPTQIFRLAAHENS